MKHLFTFICVLSLSHAAFALTVDTPLPSPEQEARAQVLFTGLRCVVCAGQTIADSDVALARDMRHHVRKMISAGADDAAVRDYFIARYGEEVLTSPPLSSHGAIFWTLPLALLGIGILMLRRVVRGGKT